MCRLAREKNKGIRRERGGYVRSYVGKREAAATLGRLEVALFDG